MLKHRPAIQLMAPQEVVVGQPFRARVVLECGSALAIDGIDIELIGSTVWYTASQPDRQRNEARFCRAQARVQGEGQLAAGRHAFDATFQLPWNLPGSYSGSWLRMEYVIHVRVQIPWWSDARASFVLHAVRPERSAVESQRVVYASSADGPAGERPYLEVSLASSVLEPGGELWGAAALANVALNPYRALRFALFAVETIPGVVAGGTHHVPRTTWTLALTRPEESGRLEFRLALPADLTPGFSLHAGALAWFLEVRADLPWSPGPRLWIPVRIQAPGATENELVQAPLAVGSQRLGLVWREVAAVTGFEFTAGTLQGAIGSTRVEIRREHRGRSGMVLVGVLRFPDLGLDLHWKGERAGRRLNARDPEQGRWIDERLRPSFGEILPVRIDDREFQFEFPDSGQDVARLRRVAERMARTALALEELRRVIPAPTVMAARVPDWQAAAQRLGGKLWEGQMAIVGTRGDAEFEVRTRWGGDGRPCGTLLLVRPPVPIDGRRQLRWTWQEGPPPRGIDFVPAELWTGTVELAVDREGIRMVLPQEADLSLSCSRLESLIALGDRLCGRTGPYR